MGDELLGQGRAGPSHAPSDAPFEREVRAKDADRERVLARLKDYYATGGLTLEELADRTDAALAARSMNDLDLLTLDLTPSPPETIGAPTRRIFGIFGSNKHSGRWRVGDRLQVVSCFGSCKVDFRDAAPGQDGSGDFEVRVVNFFGSTKLTVPSGVQVDVDGFPIFGSHKSRAAGDARPGMPRIRVRAFSFFGSLKVR